MTKKAKIKIIKKKDLRTLIKVKKVEKNPGKESARRMVQTVSKWVSDYKQRHQKETNEAIEIFFSTPPQTNGV